MQTNTITFKEALPFHKYQSLMKFLNDIGVEIIEPEQTTFSELTLEDLERIYRSKEQSKLGLVTQHSEVQKRAMERKLNRR